MVEYLTCWSSSSDQSILVDGTTYNNIETTYSHTIGNTTYDYTQNELTSMTTNALSESAYRSQYGLSEKELGGTMPEKACNLACDLMLGGSAGNNNYQIVDEILDDAGKPTGRAGGANANATSGINRLSMYLDLGQAIKATVDKRRGSSANDKIGDHFIVIMGKTETIRKTTGADGITKGVVTGTTFRFFDPGTRQISSNGTPMGASPDAMFKINNGRLEGMSPYRGRTTNAQFPYTVSSLRFK